MSTATTQISHECPPAGELQLEDRDQYGDLFRYALARKTRIDREPRSDTHRGPNVPGGSYTEHWLEPSLHSDTISLDLRDFDDDCLIPRVVEAVIDDEPVTYTLASVAEHGPAWSRAPRAVYHARLN